MSSNAVNKCVARKMEEFDARQRRFEADQAARRHGGWTIIWQTPYHEKPRWMQEQEDREVAAGFNTEKELAEALAARAKADLK